MTLIQGAKRRPETVLCATRIQRSKVLRCVDRAFRDERKISHFFFFLFCFSNICLAWCFSPALSLSLLSLSIFPLFQCSDQTKIHEPSLATAVSRLDGSGPPGFSPSSSSSSSSKGTTMPPSPPISIEPLLPSIAALCDSLSFSEKHQGREIRERGGTRRNQRC